MKKVYIKIDMGHVTAFSSLKKMLNTYSLSDKELCENMEKNQLEDILKTHEYYKSPYKDVNLSFRIIKIY